jgi:hypothetical protein
MAIRASSGEEMQQILIRVRMMQSSEKEGYRAEVFGGGIGFVGTRSNQSGKL